MLRKADFWSGLAWLMAAAFIIWQGRLLGLGKISDPGSGFAVFWIGVLLAIAALAVIWGSIKDTHGPVLADLWDGARWGRVLAVVIALIVYGAVFEWAGFLLATIALLLFLMLVIDRVQPVLAVMIALGAPLSIWVMLTKWLKIQLPAGLLAAITG